MFKVSTIPPEKPFLRTLARELAHAAGDDPCGLAADMVLLPSVRACASLRHLLLEESGRDAVLLPEVLTPGRLVSVLAERLPATGPASVPKQLRAAVLTPELAGLPWLGRHPESAAGLAEELVDLFDELRRHGIDPVRPAEQGADGELFDRDLGRVAKAWELYRRRSPRDDLDIELETIAAAAKRWPGPPIGRLTVAGFISLDPAAAGLMRAAAAAAGESRLVMTAAEGEGPVSRLFLASFGDRDAETHPSAPARATEALLTGEKAPELGRDRRPYRDRIADLEDVAGAFAEGILPQLVPCSDPEAESREIAARVIRRLRRDPRSRICVASADRGLAARVAAQLRDAGLTNIDDTGGAPLATRAEGRLAWNLLRAATSDLHHEPLLEVLTHPDVDFGRRRNDFSRMVLRFEKHVLHGEIAPGGLDGYRGLADRKDASPHERKLTGGNPRWRPFVESFAPAFSGLLDLAGRRSASCSEMVDELRRAWAAAAPGRPLDSAAGEGPDRSRGLVELAALLERISAASAALPRMPLSEFAAMLSRLMARAEVRQHRPAFLPVQITGLLEARLEEYDLLILGGMSEDIYPGRGGRPLFLGQRWRRRAGLRDWRLRLGEQADLFLRLLHNGDEVAVTWPREKDGRQVLPSPLISRLTIGLDDDSRPRTASPAALFRPEAADAEALEAGQRDFLAEGPAPALHVRPRKPKRLSHSSLSVFRECPYRYLLERGFGLREEEEILEDLRARDVGQTAHLIMSDFLSADGAGRAALAAGDEQAARRDLERVARGHFRGRHGSLPQLALWENSFLALADDIVSFELERAAAWRPAALEAGFGFTLGQLHDWLGSPDDPAPRDDESEMRLEGRIDRLDMALDGSAAMVIDYKTGAPPTAADVRERRELQLPIYAIAALIGGGDLPPAPAVAGGAYYRLGGDAPGFSRLQLEKDADLKEMGATVLAVALEALRCDGPFPLAPGEWGAADPKACAYCPFRGVCRYDERRLEFAAAAPGGER